MRSTSMPLRSRKWPRVAGVSDQDSWRMSSVAARVSRRGPTVVAPERKRDLLLTPWRWAARATSETKSLGRRTTLALRLVDQAGTRRIRNAVSRRAR